MQDLSELQDILDYNFSDISWLKLALTHRSYDRENNERLEFVGDSILDYVIAVNLYNRYPHLAEGNLSKIKAALVNQFTLVEIATKIGIGKYLLLGPGEERSGGRKRPSIIADALEAVFASVAFDSNMYQAIRVIELLYDEYMDNAEHLISKDYKSILQEYVQKRKIKLPTYEVRGTEGPDHNNVFIVECVISELGIKVPARGRSKKEASQVAAEKALSLINSKGFF
ncbi:MAG: ribonuclease [Burkholderiales bacterium]|jgi:ribonuclease-3|nr:ribonuclease [Burkholderiales bacterium]MCE3269132.1 ribonuclease [Burkholderiales bacterium]